MKTKYALYILILMGVITTPATYPADTDATTAILKRLPQLKTFIETREQQARVDTERAGETVDPDVWKCFEAARTGNWSDVLRLWQGLRRGLDEGSTNATIRNSCWQPLLEVDWLVEVFSKGDPKYLELLGSGIVDSIPRGSILFAGTEPGRPLAAAFSRDYAKGDPIFVLSQNALRDTSYLSVRRMFADKIYVPTSKECQAANEESLADAKRRFEHDMAHPTEPRQLKPGEDIRSEGTNFQVSGQIAVVAVYGLLAKITFDKTPDKEFYVEETFPLDWMCPHLTPHGWILKINRQPLEKIPEEEVRKDHEFWSKEVGKMLGNWLTTDTSVKEVCGFVQKVYLERNLDGFKGDPNFVKNQYTRKSFARLRNSIGGLYWWRFNQAKRPEEQKALIKEADFAFRQAFTLCPDNPEGLFRYINLLVSVGGARLEDAILIAETAGKFDESSAMIKNLAEELKRVQAQQGKDHD